jgi:MFS family permease
LGNSRDVTIPETSARYDGWRIVAVCFLVATFGWGLGFYGQSVYVAELHRLHGWPASLIASGTTFFYLFGALLVTFISEAIRGFGPRNCLLAGICALATAAVLIGQATSPWQLFVADAVLAFGWAGTSLGVITNTLGLWFDRKRGMAISLALNGASFGGIAGVPVLVAAINTFGFSGALTAVAVVMLVTLVPIVLVFVGQPPGRDTAAMAKAAADAPSASRIRMQALRDVAFLSVSVAFALVLFAQVGFIVHLIAFLDPVITERDGADRGLRPVRFLGRQSDHAAIADRAARIRFPIVRRACQPDHGDQPGHLRLRPRRGRPAARSLGQLHPAVLRLHRPGTDRGCPDHAAGATSRTRLMP